MSKNLSLIDIEKYIENYYSKEIEESLSIKNSYLYKYEFIM